MLIYVSHILPHNADKVMSTDEIIANSPLFITAGSETTATLMSGLIFHLLKNPATYEKLKNEIRGAFNAPSDMNFVSEAKLPYLQA